jgi:hypothetical protein
MNIFKQIDSNTIKLNDQLYTLITNTNKYTEFVKYNNRYYARLNK